MKLITLALFATGSAALFAGGNTSTATADVAVKIVSPISIVNPNQSKLDFGTVTVNDLAAGIVVNNLPNGTVDYTNCEPYTNTSIGGLAWFHVRKDHDLGWGNVNITVPAHVDLGSGVDVATQSGPMEPCFTLNGGPVLLSNTVLGVDLNHFLVGGTLTAPAGVFGSFSGTMTVTASYQ